MNNTVACESPRFDLTAFGKSLLRLSPVPKAMCCVRVAQSAPHAVYDRHNSATSNTAGDWNWGNFIPRVLLLNYWHI